jgi:hypothetical protein
MDSRRTEPGSNSRFIWIVMAGLAACLLLVYGRALSLPFLGDDYVILDKVSRSSFRDLWAPRELFFNWYRPWSREFHYWVLLRAVGLGETAYHVVSFCLWLAVMVLYFSLVRGISRRTSVATLATVGVASLVLWSAPLMWIAGVQDLWMLVFGLLFLHAVVRGQVRWALVPLVLALLSKETAAVLPILAAAYLFIVERQGPRQVVQRTLPMWIMLGAWAVLHPTLSARFFGSLPHSLETEQRLSPAMTLVRTLLAQVNLDGPLAPELGWRPILLGGAVAAAILTAVLALAMRFDKDPGLEGERRQSLIMFGAVWAVAGWSLLFLPSIGWHAYYGSLGSLGCWLSVATLLGPHRRVAYAFLVIVTLLGGARAATPSWDWGTFWYQKRAGSLLGGIRSQLFAGHPTIPPHSRLFFANLPNNIGLLAGDGPAIRIWYRDPTLRARYYSEYSVRPPGDSLGADLFFRFDPDHGLTEVLTGPEFDAPEQSRAVEWQHNQRALASLFLRAGNLRGAAGSYARLWRYFPQQAENALYAATLYDAAGDSLQAARYYRAASSALGSETVRRAAPTLVAAARDSAQAARTRSRGR